MILSNIWFNNYSRFELLSIENKKINNTHLNIIILKKSFNIFKKMDSKKINNLPTTQSAEDVNRRK